MKTIVLTATEADAGARVDSFISSNVAELSRNGVQRLIEDKQVFLLGKPVSKSHKVSAQEHFTLNLSEPKPSSVIAQDIPLDVRYEDNDLIVINKARGMVVHPAPGNPDNTLVNALLSHCGNTLSGIGGELRPGIVHRIDKDTSGLLIVAKNDESHRALSSQLKDHSLARVYQTVALGSFKQDSGTISAPIGRNPKDRKKMAVVPNGRDATTHWNVIARYNGYTHLQCALETGRTHQIRVHLANIGHPVAGDPIYGIKKDNTKLGGQCLHAGYLKFRHPKDDRLVEITCPLPDYFKDFLQRLGRYNG